MFIAFDGIDGAGKTSQVECLVRNLQKYGIEANKNNMGEEGYFDDIFRGIKHDKYVCSPEIRELMYYFEGRLFGDKIKRMCGNEIEIVDRYILTYLSYGPLNGIKFERICDIMSSMPWPDVYFYIDLCPKAALQRIKKYRTIDFPEIGCKNKLDNDENNNYLLFLKYQEMVYENYRKAIEYTKKEGKHIIRIDGKLTKPEIEKFVIGEVLGGLGNR